MKKYIALLSLIVSSLTFSSENSNDEKGTMNITAKVIRPLTVISNGDLKFGKILPEKYASAHSSYTVKGEPGATIDISFPKANKYAPESYTMFLTNDTNDKLSFSFNHLQAPTTFDKTGELKIPIAASITTKKDQARGEYKGSITLRATYQ